MLCNGTYSRTYNPLSEHSLIAELWEVTKHHDKAPEKMVTRRTLPLEQWNQLGLFKSKTFRTTMPKKFNTVRSLEEIQERPQSPVRCHIDHQARSGCFIDILLELCKHFYASDIGSFTSSFKAVTEAFIQRCSQKK